MSGNSYPIIESLRTNGLIHVVRSRSNPDRWYPKDQYREPIDTMCGRFCTDKTLWAFDAEGHDAEERVTCRVCRAAMGWPEQPG